MMRWSKTETRHTMQDHHERSRDFNVTLVTFTAMALFDALDSEPRSRVLQPFHDGDRTNWDFVPTSGRKGLPLRDMTFDQQILVHRLIAQSTSLKAYAQVVQVISLEHVQREINQDTFGHVARDFRNPGMYFLSFFGQPHLDAVWGWRLVGHHLSLNFTIVNQDYLSATPFLLGSAPGQFGPYRLLSAEEDLGFALLHSLDDEQRKRTIIHPVSPANFVTRTAPRFADVKPPAYHAVGARDVMINDAHRQPLLYSNGHPRRIPAGAPPSSPRRKVDDLLEGY